MALLYWDGSIRGNTKYLKSNTSQNKLAGFTLAIVNQLAVLISRYSPVRWERRVQTLLRYLSLVL